MPDTISSYHTFVPNTPVRAHQINTNFSNYRGTILPVDPTVAGAITNSYDLGNSSYFWDVSYFHTLHLKANTTTKDVSMYIDNAITATVFKLDVNSSTTRGLLVNGTHGGTWRGSAVSTETTALTSNFLTLGSLNVSITSYGGPLLIFPAFSAQISTSSTFGFTTAGSGPWDKFELACFASTAGATSIGGAVTLMKFRNDISDIVYARPACFYNCIGTLNAGDWTVYYAARFYTTTASGTWVSQNLMLVIKEML